MKKIVTYTTAIATALILFFGLLAFAFHPPVDGSISIIVHKDNPVAKLAAGEVKLYWLRKIKKRWPETNKNILPVDRKAKCAERDAFYSKILNMGADDVEAYFSNRSYQNAEKPQDKFSSDSEIIDFISKEVGGIGFVSSSSLSAADKEKVKVVLSI
jgi:hypothetical protein